MIVLSHPTGNENVRQAALALRDAGLLDEFWTCLRWERENRLHSLLPATLREQFARRALPSSLGAVTRTMPGRELCRLFCGRLGLGFLAAKETAPCSIDQVMRALDRRVAARLGERAKCRAVYAYEDGAFHSFEMARRLGLARIYDLPIGYWKSARAIYAEEALREPAWSMTLTGSRDSEEKLARKEAELRLASHVVVASTFTRSTLKQAGLDVPVSIIPYGAPPVMTGRPASSAGKLRVIFVGSLGQRKGISYLLEAAATLGGSVELTLLGRKTSDKCPPLDEAVRRHRWIPSLPHPELLREIRAHDVLVLPSLFEGFGLVITEAMAQGTIVIATPHTAAPDLIRDGEEGFIVPIRDSAAIAEKLELLLREENRRAEMAAAAARRAAALSWETYRGLTVEMAQDVILQQAR